MSFLPNFIKGIFIGAGAILPGISSGVICMITGIYEKLLDSILNFFKDWKQNIRFLLPIILGGICGCILFSNMLIYLFNTIPSQTKSLFMGLLLGGILLLYQTETKKEEKHSFSIFSYLSFFICFLIGILLIYLENKITVPTGYYHHEYSFSFLFLSGFLMSIGIVIPGVSSTVILMILGVYNTYLSAISIVNMNVITPLAIGAFIGSLLFMILIKFLLKKFHYITIMGIIGFGLGSIFILYPGYQLNFTSFISIILLLLGFIIGKNITIEKEGY